MALNKFTKYTMFPKSKPWGYHPEAVEDKVREYEEALRVVNEKYLEQRQVSASLQEKINRLQEELKQMHLQMSSIELPEIDEAVEHMVLDEFKSYNNEDITAIKAPEIIGDTSLKDDAAYNKLKSVKEQQKPLALSKQPVVLGDHHDDDKSENGGFTILI